ncbi:MAG: membrane protein insertase YidC [Flavobacteriales bacterium]|nr:membrane protein insertase YidC [Flavobacteriales bacterium]NNK80346.1 membrane protein insertase YidC [Flavobacteriales bacterium]
MDKNSVIGLFLIGLVVLGYLWYVSPTEEELKRQQAIQDSIRTAQEQVIESTLAADAVVQDSEENVQLSIEAPEEDSLRQERQISELSDRYGIFSPSATGEDAEIIIENNKFRAVIQSKGGQLKWLELKDYKTHDQQPLILFDERSEMELIFQLNTGQLISTADLYFKAQSNGLSLSPSDEGDIVMRLETDDPSKHIDLVYHFIGDSYEVGIDVDMSGLQGIVDLKRNDLALHWKMTANVKEKSKDREMERSGVFYRYNGDEREYLGEGKENEEELDGKTNWIAFKQNFFSAVVIHEEGFLKDNSFIAHAPSQDDGSTMDYMAELTVPVEFLPDPHAEFKLYLGPNEYKTLKSYENEMDRIIDLGWGIFGWMNKWLVIPIFNFLSKFIGSYGLIILILTIVIKLMLFPLTYKNYLSSAKMRVLKPEIDELNKKFENEKDPMKKQQATMSLYRKSGVNPAAGCLPMVVQMPILYAMFRFFPASIELRQQPFLWAEDLSSYDSIVSLPFEIPFYGAHVSLFTLLMAVSTFLYTRMNSSQMPASQPGMPNMKTIMYIFPFMMLFFFNNFASGLSYYYLLANIFSIGQMFVIKNVIIDEDKLRKKIKANQKKPVKKSNFQKRLEDAAKKRGYPAK